MPFVRRQGRARLAPWVLSATLAHALPTHAQGADPQVDVKPLLAPPARIVSLLPSLTETVCVLGACHRLVGVDRYSNWPSEVTELPRVGSTDHPLLERIVALQPDLVLVHPRSPAVEALQRLGIRVMALDARTHGQMRHVMDAVAGVIGEPQAGRVAWARIDARLDAARHRLPAAWHERRVYFDVHGAAAASESSFIGETLARLGLRNVVPGSLGTFPKLNPEFVLRAAPDVVMAPALANASPLADRPGFASLEAVRRGRTCVFGAHQTDVLMRAGPRLDEAADAIVQCLRSLEPARR